MKFGATLVSGIAIAACASIVGGCSGKHDESKVTGDFGGTAMTGIGSDSGLGGNDFGTGGNGSGASSTGGGFNPILTEGGAADIGVGAGTGLGEGGSAEVCDGVDNDHDGVIDDIDRNGDGVCDCLLIATLGVKGGSGQGDVFKAWLSARADNGADDLGDQTLTPALIAKYQVIVAQDVHAGHEYTEAEAQALSDWVNQGGGFMTLIGYTNAGEAHNVNRLLAPFMMDYTDQQILQKSGANTIPITMWTPHPIDMGVTAVGVDNGYPVEGMGDTIATGGGFDVAKVQTVGKGHVFLWGDEWVTYNSEWNDHPDYQVQLFWLNSIKWLTVAGSCQVAIPPNPPR